MRSCKLCDINELNLALLAHEDGKRQVTYDKFMQANVLVLRLQIVYILQ